MTDQTLNTGKSLQQQYAQYGATTGFQPKPLNKLMMIIAGEPGTGKSTLVESCPHLMRLDFDGASTSNPASKCVNLPGPGQNVDFAYFENIRQQLLKDAKENNPNRPSIIAIDTIDRLVRSYLVKQLEADRGKSIYDMHGQEAWALVYDKAVDFVSTLADAGYGIVLLTHIGDEYKAIRNGSQITEVYEPNFTTPRGLLKRLVGPIDLTGVLVKRSTTQAVYEPRKNRDGTVITHKINGKEEPKLVKTGEKTVNSRVLTFEPKEESLQRAASKQRVALREEVELSHLGGWDDLTAAYQKAVTCSRDIGKAEA